MTNWQPGDVALCVDDKRNKCSEEFLRRFPDWPLVAGEKYTVLKADMGPRYADNLGNVKPHLGLGEQLWFLEINHPHPESGFGVYRFVKQPPIITEEDVSAEMALEDAR